MRGNHTNNYAEAGMRIIKEIVFGRVKAYNLIQMFQFITITMEKYFSNRLLDMAHCRFRPGIALRYKELYKLQKNITETRRIRDSFYIVKENLKNIGDLEYLVDMDIGACSCAQGSDGAACKHHAAVARDFKLSTINVAPVHSHEARQFFAILAMGKSSVMDSSFYSDLHATESSKTTCFNKTSFQQAQVESTTGTLDTQSVESMDMSDTGSSPLHSTEVTLEQTRERFHEPLNAVVTDMLERAGDGDHNLLSGLSKFITSYKTMMRSPAPTSAIANALHSFGRQDSKL